MPLKLTSPPFLKVSAVFSDLRNYEVATLAYTLASSVLIFFIDADASRLAAIVATHAGIVVAVLLMGKLGSYRIKLFGLIRDWYVLLLFPLLFKELTYLTKALFPYYLEPFLISTEIKLIDISTTYLGSLAISRWLTEIMSFAYWSYYLIIFLVGVLYKKRGCQSDFNFYMFKISATFLLCYTVFILVPVRGPHHAMAGVDPAALEGGFFHAVILFMQSKGSTVGAAFPSSHVAVAWIAYFALRQLHKCLYYILIPLMLLLTVSVFYLRYHYVVDAVFGYLLALALDKYFARLENRLSRRRDEPVPTECSLAAQ